MNHLSFRWLAVAQPRRVLCAALISCLAACAACAADDWLQWGGPNRDFTPKATGLAARWPDAGPRELWSRELGPGHSSIIAGEGVLYTMYRRGEQDVIVALSAADGKTIWETAYDAPPKPDMLLDFGPGPHSSPLVVEDRLFTLGGMVHLNALDRKTGKILWSHDLMAELGASHVQRGYGPSPIAYNDLVIVMAGGKETGVVAFKQSDGSIVWKTPPLRPTESSLILAKIDGEDHLIGAAGMDRFGLNPLNGEFRWRTQVEQQSATIMSTAVFVSPDKVLYSAAYGAGTYLFQIKRKDGKYDAEKVWFDSKLKVQHGTIVTDGRFAYGSSGDFGPAFLMAVDLASGKALWRDRGFAKANLLRVDDKLIILDEEGNLALATADDKGVNVISRCKPLEEKAWTVPTLVGKTLYLRDNRRILALDLGT
ncbi:MAG: PQQ-binding-like beta-propeller repeat protein [Planctomycetes bacterium]|nr:PQQ-binding-like beta-propeller repeat protein [Planctomycetota bacterium]